MIFMTVNAEFGKYLDSFLLMKIHRGILKIILFILAIQFKYEFAYSQIDNPSSLRAYYDTADSNGSECIKIWTENNFMDSNFLTQIILIRHGKPDINQKGWFSSLDAQKYSENYNQVEVVDFETIPVCMEILKPDTIYSSILVRAISTANKLINDQAIYIDSRSLFREFEREIFTIPLIRLPLNFWLVSSRLFWYLGIHSSRIESHKAAKKRVSLAADYLETKSGSQKEVILVAHGMFNKALSKELQKRGWTLVFENGNSYLSMKIVAKKNKS